MILYEVMKPIEHVLFHIRYTYSTSLSPDVLMQTL